MTVFVLIATAVYDQGVIGVYASRETAVAAAEDIWPKTDGHHSFRIEEIEVDRTYKNVFSADYWSSGRRTTEEPRIEHVVKDDQPVSDLYNT